MLEARGLFFSVANKTLLQPTNIHFAPSTFHVLMGPNGAGKTTLLQLLAGELKPGAGSVLLDGADLGIYKRLELARRRAVLSQQYDLQFPVPVREVVKLGRYPHEGALPAAAEARLIDECLALMNMQSFEQREYGTLSGGEAQKVQMCRVLAQLGGPGATGKTLFLDEPVAHLDIRYQHALLQVARDLAIRGNTVVAVLHDINLALRYADRLLFMKDAAVVADLDRPDLLEESTMQQVFDIDAKIIRREGEKPVVVF